MEQSLDDANLRLDSSLLLSNVLNISREKLYASLSDSLTIEQQQNFQDLVCKRAQGYPLAYITGIKEFYGHDFKVIPGVLCPRPDTETMVEQGLLFLRNSNQQKSYSVLDLCTGTGCIALSLEAEWNDTAMNVPIEISASDISEKSVLCFSQNHQNFKSNAQFIKSDLFKNITQRYDLILSNPPYLTNEETQERMESSWKEPALALDGGKDGLDLIRIIIKEASDYLNPQGALMLEAHPQQMSEMKKLMEESGFMKVEVIRDLAEHQRVIKGIYHG